MSENRLIHLPEPIVSLPAILSDHQILTSEDPIVSFGSPEPILQAISKLDFGRLSGRTKISKQIMSTHPHAGLMMAAHGRQTATAFVVASNGSDIELRVGERAGTGQNLARSLSQNIGVSMGAKSVISEAQLSGFEFSCLTIRPATTVSQNRVQPVIPSLDLMLETLTGIPFIYIVFATPEPSLEIKAAIEYMNSAAQQIDRTNLKIGQQQDVDRAARQVSQFVDQQLVRLQQGLLEGLWRTSVLIGCVPVDQAEYVAGVAAGIIKAGGNGRLVVKNHRCLSGNSLPRANVNCLTSEELATLWMLPITDQSGFFVKKSVRFDIDHPDIKGGLQLGSIKSGQTITSNKFKISPDSLTHHALVCGHTGSGKSSTIRHLLRQLAELKIPFLVLEPAKSEYGSLKLDIPELTVLHAGKVPTGKEVPFQFNPFAFPKGVQLSTHIDLLKQCFVASFGLTPPMPYLLESALYLTYKSRGWNTDLGTHPHRGDRLSFPILADLLDQIDAVVDSANYDDEITRNFKGALKTRIGNLCQGAKGIALNTRDELSEELLYNSPVVLELRQLGSDQEKSLIMGLILTRLYELREVMGIVSSRDKLIHLLVIEEAHRLLKRTEAQSAEFGNMAHQAVESFANQLAEVRAYGQGVMVAEQIPSKLATEVVKQAGLKIVHRLLPADDRHLVGDAMILNNEQVDKLALLEVGEVVVHGEGMDGALLIQIPKPNEHSGKFGLSDAEEQLSDQIQFGGTPSRMAALQLAAKQYLDKLTLFRSADAVILDLISGVSSREAIGRLRAEITDLAGQFGQSQIEIPAAVIEELALEAALERRALYHQLPQSELDKWLSYRQSNPERQIRSLRESLTRPHGPKAWCHACPVKCLMGYEGAALSIGERFQNELDEIIDAPQADWSELMSQAVARAVAHDYGSKYCMPGLVYCTIGNILDRWGVATERVIQLAGKTEDDIVRDALDTNGNTKALLLNPLTDNEKSKGDVSG